MTQADYVKAALMPYDLACAFEAYRKEEYGTVTIFLNDGSSVAFRVLYEVRNDSV